MADEKRERMKAWVDNWKTTGEELDRLKRQELQSMTPHQALEQSSRCLAMANQWLAAQDAPISRPSGLVEQQFFFSKWQKQSI